MKVKLRPSHRLVKIHRSYTVEEIARLFGMHKNTVRAWVKSGLPTCDSKRPVLILGCDLAAYLHARRMKNKRPCKPGEIYCVRCRATKRPAGDMAEYQPITANLGNLIGICPDCERMIYRRASRAKLPEIQGNLDIIISEAERQVSESKFPIVNSDSSQG
jgi:Helix-turn-helix domain